MSVSALRRVDDVLRDYVVLSGENVVGEIRARGFGTAELHLGDGRYLLRRDDTADAHARGGTLAALFAQVRFGARYSLRDGDRVIARADRRFHLSPRRDGLRLQPDTAGAAQWTLRADGAWARTWTIDAAGTRIGDAQLGAGGRDTRWGGPQLPDATTAFALYALHQEFGTHPGTGT